MKNLLILGAISLFLSCSSAESNDVTSIILEGTVDITTIVQENYLSNNDVTITVNNDNTITIKSTGLPDHKTPYWGEGHELYEEFPILHVDANSDLYDADELDRLWLNSDHTLIQYDHNANEEMTSYNYAMTIPAFPAEADNKQETELSLIGMALNGVPIYNNWEGRSVLGVIAMSTFDSSGAHPGPNADYHYHTTGIFTTGVNVTDVYTTEDDNNLIGFLRDGFPIYGKKDSDGSYPNNLDENGGHIGITAQFSEEIYHYHASNENYLDSGWYILKSGSYHGTPGNYTE